MGGQTVETVAHVDRPTGQIDLDARGKLDHETDFSTAGPNATTVR
jgi:hypothetical protein